MKTVKLISFLLLLASCKKEYSCPQIASSIVDSNATAASDTIRITNESIDGTIAGMYDNLWTTGIAHFHLYNTTRADSVVSTTWKAHKSGTIAWKYARQFVSNGDLQKRERISIIRRRNGDNFIFNRHFSVAPGSTIGYAGIDLDILVDDYPATQPNTTMYFDLVTVKIMRNGVQIPVTIDRRSSTVVKFY